MSEHPQLNTADGNRRYFAVPGNKPAFILALLAVLYVMGFVIMLWVMMPDYTELQSGIAANDAARVTAELQGASISYHYEPSSGTIMVRSAQLTLARNVLVEKGLLDAYSFPVKQNYPDQPGNPPQPTIQGSPHPALEAELAKSIAGIDNVQSARVHLAFANGVDGNPNNVSRASVVVRLYPGRRLTEAQISSITHLVAASAANLSMDNITIIDQTGQMLKSSAAASKTSSLSSAQFGYLRRLEQSYMDRIEEILTPVLGADSLRTQVIADVDFKVLNLAAVGSAPSNSDANEISGVRRLSVTVMVDNRLIDDGGKILRAARSAVEMQRLTELVKHAIGFNTQRGDTVNVVNESFNVFYSRQLPGAVSVWEGLWYRNLLWYLLIGLLALFVIGLIIRPLRTGAGRSRMPPAVSGTALIPDVQFAMETPHQQQGNNQPPFDAGGLKTSFEQQLLRARQMVRDDPKIVVQIIRSWVKESG